MKNFVSVSTNAARYQDISLNPQKLAGMCAKLKCCLNYEVDNYVEASKKIPARDIVLQTADGDFHQFKTDILAGLITYSSDKNMASNLETITAERAMEIIEMNRRGEKPLSLMENGKVKEKPKSADLLAEADLSRFDKAKRKKKNNNRIRNNRPRGERNQQGDRSQQGNAPQGERGQQGNAFQGERSQQGNAPQGERGELRNNRQNNNRRRDNRNRGERRQGERPQNNRPQGERQQGERPQNNRPQGERPQGDNRPQPQQGE